MSHSNLLHFCVVSAAALATYVGCGSDDDPVTHTGAGAGAGTTLAGSGLGGSATTDSRSMAGVGAGGFSGTLQGGAAGFVSGTSGGSAGTAGSSGTRASAGTAGTGGDSEICASLALEARATSMTHERYSPPSRFILGPVFGTDCPKYGSCEQPNPSMAAEVDYHLDMLTAHDIPITLYHFDGDGWSDGSNTCTWNLGDGLRQRLQASGIRALLHFWGGCDSVPHFENLYSQLGSVLGGFYLDDGQPGVHEGATDLVTESAMNWIQSRLPGNSEVVMKANRGDGTKPDITRYGHTAYVNDLPSNFDGMRQGIELIFSYVSQWPPDPVASSRTLPAPFNEFTGYDASGGHADEETYFRRLHYGAFQVVMDHSPLQHASPWNTEYYSSALLADFRYYSWLHHELVPYLHSYDWQSYETGEPIFREPKRIARAQGAPTANPEPAEFTTKLGEELFVAYVTQPGVSRTSFALPNGEWINYWAPSEVHSGDITVSVPWGREPIFIRNGAIIPMQVSRSWTGHGTAASSDSLTVLVYPSGKSRFEYRDDARNRWVAFEAEATANKLTLAASDFPGQPILYRVERVIEAPSSVRICGTTVRVNSGAGIPASPNEDAVNGSTVNAWHYDAAAQRLIVKAVP